MSVEGHGTDGSCISQDTSLKVTNACIDYFLETVQQTVVNYENDMDLHCPCMYVDKNRQFYAIFRAYQCILNYLLPHHQRA